MGWVPVFTPAPRGSPTQLTPVGQSGSDSGLASRNLGCGKLGNRPSQHGASVLKGRARRLVKMACQDPVSPWEEVAGAVSGEADSGGHLSLCHRGCRRSGLGRGAESGSVCGAL